MAELFELLVLFLLSAFHCQRWRLLVDLPQQRVLQTHGAQVPARDEAAANEMGTKGHNLAHQHGSKDVGQLVNNPHRGIHVCLIRKQNEAEVNMK